MARANGGEPDAGAHLESWARAAGFTDVTATTSEWRYETPEERAWWGGLWADRVRQSDFARQAVASGAATPDDLAADRRRVADVGGRAHGWMVVPHSEILCRV